MALQNANIKKKILKKILTTTPFRLIDKLQKTWSKKFRKVLGLKRVHVTIPLYLDHIDFKTGILIPLTGCLKFEGVLFIFIYFFNILLLSNYSSYIWWHVFGRHGKCRIPDFRFIHKRIYSEGIVDSWGRRLW